MEVMPLCSGALMSPNVAASSPCSKYPKRFQQKWPPKLPRRVGHAHFSPSPLLPTLQAPR